MTEQREHLTVFWFSAQTYNEGFSLFVGPEPATIDQMVIGDGMSLSEFYKTRKIPMRKVMKEFPGTIEPFKESGRGRYTWGQPLIRQRPPILFEEERQKFADFVGMNITCYVARRGQYPPVLFAENQPSSVSE